MKNIKMMKSPFLSIFLHADSIDVLLMGVGFLGSLGNGLSFPLIMFITSRSMNILGLTPYSDPHTFLHSVNQNVLNFLYLAGASFLAGILDGYCWTRTGARQAARMRARYLKAVLRQEVGYFDIYNQNIFEVVSNVSNNSFIIHDAISEKVPNFISNMTRFIGSYMVAFLLMWRLALVIFPFGIIMTMPGLICRQVLMGLARKMREEYNKADTIAKQAISSIRTVYSFVGENKVMDEFSAALHGCMKLGLKQALAKGIGIGGSGITFFVWSFIAWYGSRLVMHHGAQGGTIYAVAALIGYGGPSLASALSNLKCLTEAYSIGEKVSKIIDRVPSIDSESTEGEILESILGEVEFKNVHFTYPSRPDTIILHNFNLRIPAKTTVALVGASGSGKSTVISLLERFYDPIGGQILLDGISISTLQLKWLRSQMGLVSQEPALFDLSIKENILFGKEDATIEEVIAAAKASNAHNFISQLPQGYETKVGEAGVQMSGGQKQRIAIARAVIRAPRILLLDEATSAMDLESERIVQEALQHAIEGRTTIIISHRLSTICKADAIVVIQNGRVVECGSHEELLRLEQGQYSSLIQLQQTSEATKDHDKASTSLSPLHISGIENHNNDSTGGFSSMCRSNSVDLGTITPSASINEQDYPISNRPFQKLLLLNLPEWKHASLGCLSALLFGTMQPLYAFIMGDMIPMFFTSDHDEIKSKTRLYALALAALAVFSYVTNISQHSNFATMGERLTKRIREKMLAKILTFEVGWFDQDENSSGGICARLADDANVVRSLVGDRISLLAQTFSAVLLAYTMSLIISWRLAIAIIAIQLLGVTGFFIRKVLLRNIPSNSIKFRDQSSKLAAEVVTNIQTVTSFSLHSRVLQMLDQSQYNTINRENVRQSWIAGIVLGASLGLICCNLGLNFWYGGKLIYQGHIAVTSLFKTFFILIYIGFAIADAASMTTDLAKAAGAARSVFSVLDRFTQIEPDDPEGCVPDMLMGQVELQDVHFAYPARPDYLIFEGFTLEIEAGKSTALVGGSGSGKSTVIALIERFYDPLKGTVVIDGRDVRTYRLRSLRKHIALVNQEPTLFAGTIKENIAYGAADEVGQAEIVDAAKAANAHDFISGLKDGYETWCGDRGAQLSGGQKQRIAIARAILKNPAILLLDEATSALDGKSEELVKTALDRVMVGRTSVIVAHRLSTIQNCDQIAVLDKGILMEKGTHLSLMEKGPTGAYFSLVSLQWKPDIMTAR